MTVEKLPQRADIANSVPDPLVHLIERVVMDPNASIEKLERMLEMRERLQAQQAKAAYDAAMAEAKSEIPSIIKTGEVDYTNKDGKRTQFVHETLDGIAKVIDPILSKYGLSYRFRSDQDGGNVIVTCIVAHRDGYAEETTLRGAPDVSGSKNPYQAVGSAVTYLQRYTLKLALGLSAAKDDDARGATPPASAAEPMTAEDFALLRNKIDAQGESSGKVEDFILRKFQVEALHDLTRPQMASAMVLIAKREAAQNGGAA